MPFSIDIVKRYVKNENEYERAIEYVDTDAVKLFPNRSFFKGEDAIVGEVGYEHKTRASFTLKNGQLISYGCQCQYFNENKSMCSHIAAITLKHLEFKNIENEKVVYTSTGAKRMLNDYLKWSLPANVSKCAADVKLKVVIKSEMQTARLKIYIVNGKKKYLIKDLYEFNQLFENNEVVAYGNGTAVLHSKESFDKKYYLLLDFVLNKVKEGALLSENEGFSRHSIIDKKYMVIAGADIEHIIRLIKDTGDLVEIEGIGDCEIIEGNPKLSLNISKLGSTGYQLDLKGIDSYIAGYSNIFVVNENKIYETDKKFSSKMRAFLQHYASADKKNTLELGKKDMPAFCNAVLSKIHEYISVEGDSSQIAKYAPFDLSGEFYLDIVSGRLICDVKVYYDGEEFNLFGKNILNNQICRDYEKEYALLKVLNNFFENGLSDGHFVADTDKEIYEILLYGVKQLSQFGNVYVSESLKKFKIVDSVQLNANVSVKENMLHFDLNTSEFTKRELEEVLKAYREKRNFAKVGTNKLIRLDDNGLALLAEMANDLDFTAADIIDNNIFIPKYRALYIDSRLRDRELTNYNRDSAFKSLVRTIKQVEDSDFMPTESIADTLRPYQKIGFRWLKTMDVCGFGGILADDMGMGKSIQIISLLLDEKENGTSDRKTSLIVAPSSILYNWENEIKKFGKEIKYALVLGNKDQRLQILKESQNYELLITSYELLKRDIELYKEKKFRFEIIDEAQNIKNHTTDAAKAVKKINAETRFALTGTPIENRLSELWSIFDYLMPGLLYSYTKFKEKFENPIVKYNRNEEMKGLNRLTNPFILRRLKKDVLKELPEKIESNVYTKMEGEQHKLYVALKERLRENLENQSFYDERMKVLAELTKLRQVCCQPSLCFEDYNGESAKLDTCMELIRDGVAGNHKILLFSQFTSMFPYIKERLIEENISFYELTGSTSKEKRNYLVNSFNSDKTEVFLVSLKAGGTGLNLTGADMVIHYDPWWNIAAQNQATDRAYRIGQTNDVLVFKLIMKDTIEEKILKLQEFKEKLSEDILKNSDITLSNLSKSELLSILE